MCRQAAKNLPRAGSNIRHERASVYLRDDHMSVKRPLLIFAGQLLPDGAAFTGEGKLIRKATGYEKAKAHHPAAGSPVCASPAFPAPATRL